MNLDPEIKSYKLANAYGKLRTVYIRQNEHGQFSWTLRYQDNPAICNQDYRYSDNYFDTLKAVKRSAKRIVSNLGQ